MTNTIEIRGAYPNEAGELTEIAHAAKRHWGYPEEWIALWREALSFTPEFVQRENVLVAVAAEEIRGVCAVLNQVEQAEIEHLWIRPEFMGQGLGRTLLDHAVKMVRDWGHSSIRIESDPNAVGFYRAFGAVQVGSVAATPEGRSLPVLELEL